MIGKYSILVTSHVKMWNDAPGRGLKRNLIIGNGKYYKQFPGLRMSSGI